MPPDPNRSWAVLVGASEFDDPGLDDLPTVETGLARLRDLVLDPTVWGLPPERCTVLSNPRSGDELLDAIAHGCAAADDAFLLYYAGHGILDPRPFELYLATTGTTLAPILRSVRFDDVRRVLDPRRSLAKVVILDCCYSGMAARGAMSDGTKLSDRMLVNRSYVLAATSATRLALAPPDEEYPAFTGELIRVLADGIPGGPDDLTMAAVYGQVLTGLTLKRRPTPQASADNDGHAIVIARNRAALRPAEGPAAAEAVAPLPAGHARVLGLTPADTVGYLVDAPDAERAPLVDAIAVRREPQQVAAVVHALRRAGRLPLAAAVAAAAARRPAGEILATVESLDVLGLDGVVDDLLRAVGRAGDAVVGTLVPLLPEPRREMLLGAAVLHLVAEPAALIRLVGVLWTAESRRTVERVLRTVAGTMRPEEAAVLADTLSDGGYDEAAFQPYLRAEEVIGARPPHAAVRVAVSMGRAGHRDLTDALLANIVRRCADAATAYDALDAFHAAGLDAAADNLLETMADRLDDGQVTDLSQRLRAGGRPGEALGLLQRAAARRPVGSAEAYFRFLFDRGLGMDARDLLVHLGTVLDVVRLARLAVLVDTAVPEASFASDLIRAAAARDPGCARGLIVQLGSEPDPAARRLGGLATYEVAHGRVGHALRVAAGLIEAGRESVADTVVRLLADRFGTVEGGVLLIETATVGHLEPAVAGTLLDRVLVDAGLRESFQRSRLWMALLGHVDHVATSGSVRAIRYLVERSHAVGLTFVEERVLAALRWGPETLSARVEPTDPRRFHVAAWLAGQGRCPEPAARYVPHRSAVTPVAVAVAWCVGSRAPDLPRCPAAWERWLRAEFRMDAGEEVMFAWSLGDSGILAFTATGVRFRLPRGRRQTAIPYADLAAAQIDVLTDRSVRIRCPGRPVSFLTLPRTDTDPLARWVLQRLYPDRSEAPPLPLSTKELRDLLADVAALAGTVLSPAEG